MAVVLACGSDAARGGRTLRAAIACLRPLAIVAALGACADVGDSAARSDADGGEQNEERPARSRVARDADVNARGALADDAQVASDGPPAESDVSSEDTIADGGFAPVLPHDQPEEDSAAARQRSSLVQHDRWIRVVPAEDPFADRPALVVCSASASMAELLGEESVFSVDTEGCNYITVVQPTLHEIAENDTLKVRLWHFELSAAEPAEAHAALQVDGLRFFDERIPIPKSGGLVSRRVKAPRAIPAGAPIYFHLHNHGENSWSLVEVSSGP